MKKTIIAIGRQFGSGGHTIGQEVAKKLDVPFYDQNLVQQIAHEAGYDAELIAKLDDGEASKRERFLYGFVGNDVAGMSASDYLWEAEQKVINDIAKKGPCVIVGRCADFLLGDRKDTLTVFIHADPEIRAKRIVERYGETKKTPMKRLRDKDKQRAMHYNYYTGRKWGDAMHYDLCLDSGTLGIDRCVNFIVEIATGQMEEN